MSYYCRICCRELAGSSVPLHYRSEISTETVLNMIAFVTGLKVSRGDGYPQQICRICLGQLLISYELKRTSIESQSYFRRLFLLPPLIYAQEEDLQASPVLDMESELTAEQYKLEPEDVAMAEEVALENDADYCYSEVMYFCCWDSCMESFDSEDSLAAHFELLHKEGKELNAVVRKNDELVCNICARGFNDEAGLLLHCAQVKRKALRCKDCYYITYSQTEYIVHCRSHPQLMRCVCGYSTTRKYSLKRHLVSMCCEEIYGKKVSLLTPKEQRSGDTGIASKTNLPHIDKCTKTNNELIAMGFNMTRVRESSKFYCCISKCQVGHDSEKQCVEHFENNHRAELLQSTNDESSGNEGIKCNICRRAFSAAKDLLIHREDSYQPTFLCKTCGTDGFTRNTALTHSTVACKVNKFTCPCGFLTNESSSLRQHFKSEMCNRSSMEEVVEETSQSMLSSNSDQEEESNSEQQSDVRRYVCEHCGASRKSEISLTNHQRLEKMRTLREQWKSDSGREVDGIPGKVYTCKWCDETTNNLAHLIQCMVNAKERFRCKLCQQKFFSRRRFNIHSVRGCRNGQPVEVKLANFKCPYCERRFYHPSVVERHVTVDHRDDSQLRPLDPTRKYICGICGYQFRRKFSLNRHLLVHRKRSETGPVVTADEAGGST